MPEGNPKTVEGWLTVSLPYQAQDKRLVAERGQGEMRGFNF
jgi:hypothetical protein